MSKYSAYYYGILIIFVTVSQILGKKNVIIDSDCAVDDAIAIMLAAQSHKNNQINIIGITSVFGNTYVDNTFKNVRYTLRASEIKGIDVYKGCSASILGKITSDFYYGIDGFRGAHKDFAPLEHYNQKEHSVNALIRMVKENPKNISIVVIGPLTNIAAAQLIDPNFLNNVKELIILGGNINGLGNVSPSGEFNFLSDPEAVHSILTQSKCPITLIPLETSLQHMLPWDKYDEIINFKTIKSQFLYNVTKQNITEMKNIYKDGMEIHDFIAMAMFLHPEMIMETQQWPSMIELQGEWTRGQLIVDKRGYDTPPQLKRINIITKVNQTKLMDLLVNVFKN